MANHVNVSNAAMYGGMNAGILPSAGHHSDLQLLMRDVDTLSGYLQRNREEWLQLQEGLARVERMHGRLAGESLQNGEIPLQPTSEPSPSDPTQTTMATLQTSLAQANTRIATLETSAQDQQNLQTLYEESLTEATERVRTYIFSQQTYITELHRNYAALLETARWETIQAQVTHQAWQDGLKKVCERLREAVAAREEEARPFRGRIAALKSENRILRQMVGWEPPVDSDDEEADEEEQQLGQAQAERGGRGLRSRDGLLNM